MPLAPILLASLLLTFQGQSRFPGATLSGKQLDFFRQVITTPTGANGYEEYVEAAAILKESNFGEFQSLESMTFSDQPKAFFEDKDGKKTFVPIPDGLTIESTTLQVRQACIRRFGHEKLTYERPTPTTFVIQSKGFGDLGPIGLVYRRAGPGQSLPPGWVPPPNG